jgi:hypothetical protein
MPGGHGEIISAAMRPRASSAAPCRCRRRTRRAATASASSSGRASARQFVRTHRAMPARPSRHRPHSIDERVDRLVIIGRRDERHQPPDVCELQQVGDGLVNHVVRDALGASADARRYNARSQRRRGSVRRSTARRRRRVQRTTYKPRREFQCASPGGGSLEPRHTCAPSQESRFDTFASNEKRTAVKNWKLSKESRASIAAGFGDDDAAKPLEASLAVAAGLEPATTGLTIRRSTN